MDRQRVRQAVAQAWRKKTEEDVAAKPQRMPEEDELSVGTGATDPLTDNKESVMNGDILSKDNGLQIDGLQVTYPATKEKSTPNTISQDDSPLQNSRSEAQALLSVVKMLGSCPSARQSASRTFPMQILVDFAAAVIDDEPGELLEYRHLIQRPKYKKDWDFSFGNEIGRPAQGMRGRNEGTDTLEFIDKKETPNKRWKGVAHSRIVCNVQSQKEGVNRTRLTYRGQNLDVSMDCRTLTANLLTIKLLLNSIISTPGARFTTNDIKGFYLNNPLEQSELGGPAQYSQFFQTEPTATKPGD